MAIVRLLGIATLSFLGVGCAATSVPAKAPESVSTAQQPPADQLDALSNEQLVDKLLVQTGSAQLGIQIFDAMVVQFRGMPNLPPTFLQHLKEMMNVDELTARVRPIYLKAYDRKTLLSVVRFYDTEEGKKVIVGLPHVMSEAMAVGQKWGKELAEKALAASKPPETSATPASPGHP